VRAAFAIIVVLTAALGALAACGFGDDRLHAHGDDDDAVDAPDGDPDAAPPGDGRPPVDAAVDAAIDAAPVACSLVPQSGCPAGDACDLTGTDGDTTCRDVTTAGTEDDACSAATQCSRGYKCIYTDNQGSCLEFCASDADCAPATGSRCVIELDDGTGQTVPGGTFCSQACSPQTASGCPAGWNCAVLEDGNADVTRCIAAGSATQDDACSATVACASGYTCATYNGDHLCLRNCRVGMASGCNNFPGTTCTGFSTPTVIGGVEWGVCL
jgi:hypothetical protein